MQVKLHHSLNELSNELFRFEAIMIIIGGPIVQVKLHHSLINNLNNELSAGACFVQLKLHRSLNQLSAGALFWVE